MTPYYTDSAVMLYCGDSRDVLAELPEVDCIVTSPPYFGLRSYLPNAVMIRKDLSIEKIQELIGELERLGIHPNHI